MIPPSRRCRAARRGLLLHDARALRLSGRSAPGGAGFAKAYKAKYGIEPNFHGEVGYTAAQIIIVALKKAGKDLTTDTFTTAMESIHDYNDIFGNPLSFGPNQHHGSTSLPHGR